ncbi:Molybdenum ABC transporter, periplasmic molybdenum-binding protein ModA [Desulfurella amilsii]|uniref:Molybdenum ABC transporter, periplasmic molybdenum-binding protein ModA n=1 Tax=Desulfurella amilsii TaxID=1562698 RepID=A0A1X4XVG1_9BACT|nr:molybdate ABC transporter substrate-binding protein [Desulfurella amilsii]OSS41520.1 Molybdenum ABC transporter, periplasmic molybdenum-binding protein ModA [Desulfurella amilsii]
MDNIRLACAPNLSGIIEEIIDSFYDKAVSFELTIGDNCNVYYKEILSGKPYDIFLAADEKITDDLFFSGLAKKSAIYAKSKLCLWSLEYNISNLSNIKIALPDPNSAPYGKAAFEYLENTKILNSVKENLLFGTSPFEVSRLVLDQKAQVAFLPVSFVKSVLKNDNFKVLEDGYNPVVQKGVLLLQANNKAQEFFDFLVNSKQSKQILNKFGF